MEEGASGAICLSTFQVTEFRANLATYSPPGSIPSASFLQSLRNIAPTHLFPPENGEKFPSRTAAKARLQDWGFSQGFVFVVASNLKFCLFMFCHYYGTKTQKKRKTKHLYCTQGMFLLYSVLPVADDADINTIHCRRQLQPPLLVRSLSTQAPQRITSESGGVKKGSLHTLRGAVLARCSNAGSNAVES